MYYNEYDVAIAKETFKNDPVLTSALDSLEGLIGWTNRNSDGWTYWPKPGRAAQQLLKLIDQCVWDNRRGGYTVTAAQVKKALVPIKAFLTRQGVDHALVIQS